MATLSVRRVCTVVFAASLTAGAFARPALANDAPVDFGPQARLLHRIAACGDSAAIPTRLRAKHVDEHCKRIAQRIERFRTQYLNKARPFLATIVPKDVPRTVVYPFGGSDLLAALIAYPELDELTTLSLEPAGDPRAIDTITAAQLRRELYVIAGSMTSMFRYNYGVTKVMRPVMNEAQLPVHLAYALTALTVHGFEPVSLRYFSLNRDGTIRYVTAADLKRIGKRKRWAKKHHRIFNNMELRFRRIGDRSGRVRTYRHLLANLHNYNLSRDDRVMKHLEAKGRVAAIAKAANYMYWWPQFTRVRDYMLKHMAWMISDASGPLEKHARQAGFEQVVWGKFGGAHVKVDKKLEAERKLQFRRQPYRPTPIRFGYGDISSRSTIIVTRPIRRR